MTEHTALYRKYRPQGFDEVLGQQHVVKALEGAIKEGKVAHAYLFSGSRGTGKTSLARIFAKSLGTTERDLYEIDAASNRGVDDVRALREEVNNVPFESTYKVYIVDEVHMLTKEAFNALLKTLEEPPRHVIFILATTELDRLPETVVSRCQTYRFSKPTTAILKEMVTHVAKREGYVLDPASADLIALLADGSFRDALGVLQKAIGSSSDKKISADEVRAVLGAPKNDHVFACIDALSDKDADRAIRALGEAVEAGTDVETFSTLLLRMLRAVLLLRGAPSFATKLREDLTEEEFLFIQKHADGSQATINSRLLVRLLDASAQLGHSSIASLPLELAILDSSA